MKIFRCTICKKKPAFNYWALKEPSGRRIAFGHFCPPHFIAVIREHLGFAKVSCVITARTAAKS